MNELCHALAKQLIDSVAQAFGTDAVDRKDDARGVQYCINVRRIFV